MTGPDYQGFQNWIRYDETEAPVRLVYTHGLPDGPERFRVTVTFGADDGALQPPGSLGDHLRAAGEP